jgi:hypothetical protein
MRTTAKFALAVSVLLAAAPAAAGHMTDFDLNKLNDWSEAIAVCDVTRFLLTEPDVTADAILVVGRNNRHTALYRPLFQPPNNFFSDIMRETFHRVEKAGFVTRESYARARIRYAGLMISAYAGATFAEKHYMADQMELCYQLAARAGVKLPTKPRDKT